MRIPDDPAAAGSDDREASSALLTDRIRGIAYHEAGHAVVGTLMGLDLLGMDIVSDGAGGRGHTRFAQPWPGGRVPAGHLTPKEREEVVGFAVTFLAGYAAEARLGRADPDGSGYDERDLQDAWIALLTDDSVERQTLAASFLARARSMLEDPATWKGVVAVAERLLAVRSLTGVQVRELTRPGNAETSAF